jgi:UDP-glucose 4-epimerase
MKILVTGANGFLGTALCNTAMSRGLTVHGATRSPNNLPKGVNHCAIGNIDSSTDWQSYLIDCEVLVHLAARVHVMNDRSIDPLEEFRRVNVQGALNLAQQAANAGVRRFVFISSIKVNGESTQLGSSFHADDVPAPQDAYGISKMEAEHGLRTIAVETGMEVVIIRPSLVYGPGVKGNFATMMRWLSRSLPLPLGAIRNHRSLVALDNLVDLILLCLTHPNAANQTFLVSDGDDISTTDLLMRMGQAMSKPAQLVPVPVSWLRFILMIIGKNDVAQRLCSSLQVDINKTRNMLGWNPPLTLDQGLKKTAVGSKL